LIVAGTEVYAAGWSFSASGVSVAGYWKNDSWHGLPPLVTGGHAQVFALAVVD
jgi:hypothetical protein